LLKLGYDLICSKAEHNTIVGNNRSPFGREGQGHSVKSFADLMSETDISFVSSSRPSTDRMSSVTYDFMDSGATPRFSTSSDTSLHSGPKFFSPNYHQGFSSISQDSGRTSFTGSTHSLVSN
jgi:hypothetical protein